MLLTHYIIITRSVSGPHAARSSPKRAPDAQKKKKQTQVVAKEMVGDLCSVQTPQK